MVREISEMARKNGAFEFRITSLLPLNPDNAPDVFEKGALEKFEKGEEEVFIKEHFEESTFFRYMAPLIMEDSCLSCHGEAYSVGDIRGGISVRFNIDAVEAALVKNIFIVLGLALLTLLSLFAIIYRLVAQLKRRLRQAEVKLREMASTDELTGLKNRRYLGERLHVEFKQARRYARTISCIMFDLDDFKRINDTLGHDAGDEVLRAVGHVTKSVCRETDIPSRFGGDEFVIILPDTDLRGGVETAERLHRAISSEKIRLPDGGVLTFTASFGVASTESLGRHDANEEASLLKRADDALYRAKGRGRNCVEKDDLECTGNALRIKSLASS